MIVGTKKLWDIEVGHLCCAELKKAGYTAWQECAIVAGAAVML